MALSINIAEKRGDDQFDFLFNACIAILAQIQLQQLPIDPLVSMQHQA